LRRARSYFHFIAVPTSQDPKAALFDMDDEAFAVAASDAGAAKEKDFRRACDMVWSHDSRASQAWSGHAPDSAAKSFLSPNIDEIKGISADYCASDDLVSTDLEWALLDCLAHDSLVEFFVRYRTAGLLKATVSGQRISGPLIRGEFVLDHSTARNSVSGLLLNLASEWLGKAIGEGLRRIWPTVGWAQKAGAAIDDISFGLVVEAVTEALVA